ncbi:putative peptidase (DUF1758) domain-containing protein [Phthorimaea operculella]|nr:putative peptidase (DUF1758) domain-containing protein [Phthorimaea operculella]
MGELLGLRRKRGTCKQLLTNFEKFVVGFGDDLIANQVQVIEIKTRLSKIDATYAEFCLIQSEFENLVSDDELEAEYVERSEYDTKYYRNVARAEALCLSYEKSKPKKAKASTGRSGTGSGSSSTPIDDEDTVKKTDNAMLGVKLPTITIPKFSGEYGNWLEFRDTYISMIHSRTCLSNIQKFHYLRASLVESAAEVIRALDFSAANYTLAWNLLCERYDNTRLLVQNHVKAIFNEEPIKRESAHSIRRLVDSYSKNLRSLDNLGEPTLSWDTLVIYIVASKLDVRTLREWEEEKIKHKVVSLEMFTKFLKNRADLLDTIEQSFSKAPAVQAVNTNNNYNVKTFAAAAQPVPRVYQCPCSICKGRHNSLLHKDTEPVQETATSLTSNSVCGQVLLATAMVNIRDSKNTLHEVRAVLDNGSQSSFMSESLLNKLALKPEEVCVSISGINSTASKSNKRCKSIIQSTLNDYQVEVEFLVLPHIASTGNPIVDVRSRDVPPHIKLADPKFYNPSSVDLLLGADIFWDLLGTNKLRASKDESIKLMLYETELGYIVSGPTGSSRSTQKVSCNFNLCDSWRNLSSMFRVTEEKPVCKKQMLSLDEQVSEELLNEDVSHETDSRFSLAVPINSALGYSFNRANKSCFLSEKLRLQRLAKLIVILVMYTKFLKDYADLGHMTICDIEFRSVLDSRALSSYGLSLNDIQMVGPTTHSGSLSILFRFRHPSVLFESCKLNAVIYGTAPAPFLASGSQKLLADRHKGDAARTINEDVNIDGLIASHGGIGCSQHVKTQWCTDLRVFKSNLRVANLTISDSVRMVDLSEQFSALKLKWSPSDDELRAFGEIKTLRLPKKLTPGSEQHRGFAFVDFHSKADAKSAFEALCQSTHLYGRRLVLEWADQADEADDVAALRKRTAQAYNARAGREEDQEGRRRR